MAWFSSSVPGSRSSVASAAGVAAWRLIGQRSPLTIHERPEARSTRFEPEVRLSHRAPGCSRCALSYALDERERPQEVTFVVALLPAHVDAELLPLHRDAEPWESAHQRVRQAHVQLDQPALQLLIIEE